MQRNSLLLTGILLLALFSFGAADALLVEPFPETTTEQASSLPASGQASSQSSQAVQPIPVLPGETIPSSSSSEGTASVSSVSSAAPTVDITPTPAPSSETPPEGAVTKKSDTDPLSIALRLNFTAEETDEKSLLSAVVKEPSLVQTRVLLLNGDRAGLLAWIETPNVKQVFLVLKDSLATLFSPEVRDLLDEMQSPSGKPPRNFLTFLDPALSEERFVFVRIRERLYEFHIATGKDEAMYKLVEALTE